MRQNLNIDILFKQNSYPRVGTEIACYTACFWYNRSSIAALKQPLPPKNFIKFRHRAVQKSWNTKSQHSTKMVKFFPFLKTNPITSLLSSFLKDLSCPKPTFIRWTRGCCLVIFWSEIFLLFTSSHNKYDVSHYTPYFFFVFFSSHFRKLCITILQLPDHRYMCVTAVTSVSQW